MEKIDWLAETANGVPTQAKLAMSKLPSGSHSPNRTSASAFLILISMPNSLAWAWISCSWVSRSLLPAVVEMLNDSFLPPLAKMPSAPLA